MWAEGIVSATILLNVPENCFSDNTLERTWVKRIQPARKWEFWSFSDNSKRSLIILLKYIWKKNHKSRAETSGIRLTQSCWKRGCHGIPQRPILDRLKIESPIWNENTISEKFVGGVLAIENRMNVNLHPPFHLCMLVYVQSDVCWFGRELYVFETAWTAWFISEWDSATWFKPTRRQPRGCRAITRDVVIKYITKQTSGPRVPTLHAQVLLYS